LLENTRCVVLNATYEPLSVVSARRGLRLIIEGRAVLEEQYPNGWVRSPTKKFPLPTQVRLKKYIETIPALRVPAQLTQRNLFLRDRYTCQYCGRQRKDLDEKEYLTRDHIIPAARGGKDSWTNVVTACKKCNNIKADYLLSELEDIYYTLAADPITADTADWILEHMVSKNFNPRAPMILEIWSKSGNLRLRKKKKK